MLNKILLLKSKNKKSIIKQPLLCFSLSHYLQGYLFGSSNRASRKASTSWATSFPEIEKI